MPYRLTGRPNGRPRKVIPPPDGMPPNLSMRQWRALGVETAPFFARVPPPVGFIENTRSVARAAGISRRTVQRWRHDELYGRGFLWLLRDVMAALQQLHRNERWLDLYPEDAIYGWVEDNWHRSSRSPLDGRLYTTSEEYALHLLRSRAFHPEWKGPRW